MRILVVDDEVRLAEGVRRGLEAEGFAVDVAHNGIDGTWRARATQYDAIVLDLIPKCWRVWATQEDTNIGEAMVTWYPAGDVGATQPYAVLDVDSTCSPADTGD